MLSATTGSQDPELGLVGKPVRVQDIRAGSRCFRGCGRDSGTIFYGEHGVEEIIKPGERSHFYDGTGFINGYQLEGYCCICIQWPLSATIWIITFLLQFLSPCFYCCLGNAFCYNPSQINYIHSLYVVWHTYRNSWFGYIFCCCGYPQIQPGVLFATVRLATPPLFFFDEDKDKSYLMTFNDYVDKKSETFPPFSGKYRAIDGGGNHKRYTFLGQGCRGYAMNEPFMVLNPSVMPDADDMQRALQLRTTFKESPFGQNAISAWFANVATHDFFRSATGSDNVHTGGVNKPWVNLHSSYLDLQPLYGWNQEIANSIRTFEGGKLFKIAENRFDGARNPGSAVIVKLLMMEHNYVCDELAARYPDEFDTDEKLYQQARLIMGAVYINIILRQYGDQMFGENAPDGRGFAELRLKYGTWPTRGNNQTVGNHGTFNFNLIYRWHTGIPVEWDAANPMPIETKDEMRAVLQGNLHWKAGGFGPNNMPDALFQRHISVPAVAVRDGRLNGAPRLNDFRRRFTRPYTSFEDMCGDPEVAAAVAKWYPTVEDVELAVGFQVERTSFGGWSLGNTVAGAILADAFNSIRQDRFYTDDFTPKNYTEWGYDFAKNTNLVDVINRHLDMGLDRDMMLARVPDWKGPPTWSEMEGFWPISSFTPRGWPILKGSDVS